MASLFTNDTGLLARNEKLPQRIMGDYDKMRKLKINLSKIKYIIIVLRRAREQISVFCKAIHS